MMKRLKELMRRPENQTCCDCSSIKADWVTLIAPSPEAPQLETIGAFCCIECSGAHRSLGTHICFVRSIHLDECKYSTVKQQEVVGC
jgi:stromal membrane-associated protein